MTRKALLFTSLAFMTFITATNTIDATKAFGDFPTPPYDVIILKPITPTFTGNRWEVVKIATIHVVGRERALQKAAEYQATLPPGQTAVPVVEGAYGTWWPINEYPKWPDRRDPKWGNARLRWHDFPIGQRTFTGLE